MSRTALVPIATLLLATAVATARADVSASSAASQSVSTSVGSSSTSLDHSSRSSTGDDRTAAGDYRIIEMAAAAERAGALRLTLQAVPGTGAEGEFHLYLPSAAVQRGDLETGRVITVRARPYGLEFARQAAAEPFFLVLADDWYRELRTTAVTI